ncbi:MAG: DUF2079 domain-containing protein [Candidatus Omnitrophota bacterium]
MLIEIILFWRADDIFNIPFRKALLLFSSILVILTFLFFIAQARYYKYMWFIGCESKPIPQAFWNTLNGGGFLYYSGGEGVSLLLIHLVPLILIALPFYAIYPDVHTLIFIQSVFFCFAALPLFLIAVKRLNGIAAMVISFSFLLHPFIVGPAFTAPFKETVFIAFFMFFTFYFFENKRFYPYLLFLVLSMMARETVPLTCFMFTIYAILKKRPVKWVVSTAVLTVSYFMLFLFIQQCFDNVAFTTFTVREAYFDSAASGSVVTSVISRILNPGALMRVVVDVKNAKYIFRLLSPCGLILPLLSFEIIFVIPQLLVVLLSSNRAFLMPFWHHSVEASIFIWLSCVFGISKISNNEKIIKLLGIGKEKLSLVMVVFLVLMALSTYHTWYVKNEKMDSSYYNAIDEAVSLIPQDAAVSGSSHILPRLHKRRNILYLYEFAKADYIIIDRRRKAGDVGDIGALGEGTAKKYKTVFEKEGITVYAKERN